MLGVLQRPLVATSTAPVNRPCSAYSLRNTAAPTPVGTAKRTAPMTNQTVPTRCGEHTGDIGQQPGTVGQERPADEVAPPTRTVEQPGSPFHCDESGEPDEHGQYRADDEIDEHVCTDVTPAGTEPAVRLSRRSSRSPARRTTRPEGTTVSPNSVALYPDEHLLPSGADDAGDERGPQIRERGRGDDPALGWGAASTYPNRGGQEALPAFVEGGSSAPNTTDNFETSNGASIATRPTAP